MISRWFPVLSAAVSFVVSPALFSAEVGVRIRFGMKDKTNTVWSGSAEVEPGRVDRVSGWRFQFSDKAEGNHWQAETRELTTRRAKKAPNGPGAQKAQESAMASMADNGVLLRLVEVSEDSVVKVQTANGSFDFKLSEVPYGKALEKLEGAVEVERTAATQPIAKEKEEEDFPSIAIGSDGTVYTAYVSFSPSVSRGEVIKEIFNQPTDFSFLSRLPGADRLWLNVRKPDGKSETVAVTPGGGDLYKTALAVDGSGKLWIFWSENAAWKEAKAEPNFELWTRSYQEGNFSDPMNLSAQPGSDVNPVAATDSQGRVWVAWQGERGGAFRILERHQSGQPGAAWSPERRVSTQEYNCWTPAIAGSKDGRVAICWDTYEKGDYDVWMREYAASGKEESPRAVAASPEYEARPSATYDGQGRLWICWELGGPTWGKDWGAYERNTGIGLYRSRKIGMRVWADGRWLEPEHPLAMALPGQKKGKLKNQVPVRRPESVERAKGQEAETDESQSTYDNLGRIAADSDGRIWLLSRNRQGSFFTAMGSVWMNSASYYDGSRWVGPILLPHSDNLLYNLPAVSPHPGGGLIIAHSSDHRQSRHAQRPKPGSAPLSAAEIDPFDNDVYLSRLEVPSGNAKTPPPAGFGLKAVKDDPQNSSSPAEETVKERETVARMRQYRFDYNGKPLQVIRGEFHRHTEISGDGGSDGPLEDMWRYALDVAAMDWLGNGDHDNGAGREYLWWLTQKTTDAFRIPGKFEPPFTYERSVRYPEGHRNVVFAQRGVRTLPKLPISARDNPEPAADTLMLYRYLKQFKGVCASHTSATGMGTDWRNSDAEVEPMVEIYQGARQNYERPGAPRSPSEKDAIGGWEPLGFVNLALKKGIRFSFQASSDHGSTHISYAMVCAEANSREALLSAMRQRHTYAATDNILAEYTCKAGGKTHMMGDEFSTDAPPALHLHLSGTAPFERVVLVKDDEEIKTWEPGTVEVDIHWTDPAPEAGKTSYYYFRGEQRKQGTESNGELVWASPMWITFSPRK